MKGLNFREESVFFKQNSVCFLFLFLFTYILLRNMHFFLSRGFFLAKECKMIKINICENLKLLKRISNDLNPGEKVFLEVKLLFFIHLNPKNLRSTSSFCACRRYFSSKQVCLRHQEFHHRTNQSYQSHSIEKELFIIL